MSAGHIGSLRWVLLLAFLSGVLACESPSAFARETHDGVQKQVEHPPESTVPLDNATATVAFSPDGECQALIVSAISGASRQIMVQAYGFTNKEILNALSNAHRRGVDVRIILDKSNETAQYSGATYVSNAGIPVWIDDKVAIAHNKVMIVDGTNIITGSFNFTASAQKRNAENVLYLQNVPQLAATYLADWNWRKGLSHPYQRR